MCANQAREVRLLLENKRQDAVFNIANEFM